MAEKESEAMLRGQAEIWRNMLCFADSMALKCAVELKLADIINSHGSPISLSQISSSIVSSHNLSTTPDISYLSRIMRLLVRRDIFTVHHSSDGTGESLYGLTPSSKWLLRDSDLSLAPMILAELHQWLMNPWHCFSQCVKDGGIAFEKSHGVGIWDLASRNPDFNGLFNDAMASSSKVVLKAVVSSYGDGFLSVGSLVDVGGGIGGAVSEIVKSYPHIKGINYDLPHVIKTAPEYRGVTHVGGDMFEAVPEADAVFMKWILHDWDDEDCIRILKNCRKSIGEKKGGKVVIVDVVLKEDGVGPFDDTRIYFDLLMLAHTNGKERTEFQWNQLLKQAGFPRYNIITIPALTSIIEAFPI